MLSLTLVSCGTQSANEGLKKEHNQNQTLQIAERFGSSPQVIADPLGSGAKTAELIFEKSEIAVLSGPERPAQARAASISAVAHAPMMVSSDKTQAEVVAALEKLGVHTVLLVGEAKPIENPDIKAIVDPGTSEALSELTSLEFEQQDTDNLIRDIANLDPEKPVEITLPTKPLKTQDLTVEEGFPSQGKLDGNSAPPILVSPKSPIASVATAKAFGAPVKYLPYSDPRYNAETVKQTTGLSEQPVIALGSAFGESDKLKDRIIAAETLPEQPGGGGLVFPGRRVVALYGHPSGPALGVMGERPPKESAEEAKRLAEEYSEFTDGPVVPAFEIIATVATAAAGPDGDYSGESDPEELVPYIDAITEAGGYAILDLQPGRANLLDQAKLYEELLKRPNVGLAVDPEWKLGPDQMPMQVIGQVDAAEVNEVSEWLAELTRENELPQKPFVIHQFQMHMIQQREDLEGHDELAMILHADGHGVPSEKMATWDQVRKDLDPRIFMAWKNFYDEDKPMFTPEETMDIKPRPWLVTFQ